METVVRRLFLLGDPIPASVFEVIEEYEKALESGGMDPYQLIQHENQVWDKLNSIHAVSKELPWKLFEQMLKYRKANEAYRRIMDSKLLLSREDLLVLISPLKELSDGLELYQWASQQADWNTAIWLSTNSESGEGNVV